MKLTATKILALGAAVALVVYVWSRRKVDASITIGDDWYVKRGGA